MAAFSASAQDPQSATPGILALPLPSATATSRRLPPPCWSHEETVALLDAYRDKWYSLRRSNLRASHWQEVADDVAARCPVSPVKTSVQCRHKMEKLRKRYRAEIQRASTTASGRYCSSWVHFKRMEFMEKGPTSAVPVDSSPTDLDEDEEAEDDEDEQEGLYQSSAKHGVSYGNRNSYGSMSNGIGGGSGFRIRIPGRSNNGPVSAQIYSRFDEKPNYNYNPNPNFGSTKVLKNDYMGRFGLEKRGGGGEVGKKRELGPLAEMVSAIKVLGDGFVRMEKMKMDMAREVEAMRMEMEIKRTEMILESQQRIVEAFSEAFSDRKNKKTKRMPTPEA